MSATVVWMLLKTRAGRFALDKPNARSLHATPVPRLGGIGIVAGDADNVSCKVLRTILSYTEYVNRTVWFKS